MRQRIKLFVLFLGNILYRNSKSKVIYYHDLHGSRSYTKMSTSIEEFEMHLTQIRLKNYKIVNQINKENQQIKICFDDGFKGIFDHKDFLIANNVFVEIFLITDFIGEEGYLTKKEILELDSFSNFSFGSHTETHANLGDLDDISITQELAKSKEIIESLLNRKINSLCFPRGIFSDNTVRIAKALGYNDLYSSIPGSFRHKTKQFDIINRYLVQFASKKELRFTLNGGQDIFKDRITKQHYRS
ncbi:polysaccharide deacetylase family protein [Olleya sp. HaHaR_3_96]|uniref:polysaccharide deacetylase family protein n=1 Tax=Olleya sp. HaHaR_3_96 TaxID=2745560 RepID=UPI001C4F0942|nr:polysaccharide deacetylase family protein [Olleya sp. HaHaR_3_96]QXP60664.1 polysaccharide deacetylase family protein [Olleya sp. HaHaR_3_96]